MRIILSFLLFAMISIPVSSQLVVELAAFDQTVDKDYFKGFSNVYHVQDQSNINRYYVNATAGNADALVEQGRANRAQSAYHRYCREKKIMLCQMHSL